MRHTRLFKIKTGWIPLSGEKNYKAMYYKDDNGVIISGFHGTKSEKELRLLGNTFEIVENIQ